MARIRHSRLLWWAASAKGAYPREANFLLGEPMRRAEAVPTPGLQVSAAATPKPDTRILEQEPAARSPGTGKVLQ